MTSNNVPPDSTLTTLTTPPFDRDDQVLRLEANIDPVNPWVWTGGDLPYSRAEAVRRIELWWEMGIRFILDCRKEANDAEFVACVAPGITYEHVGVDDAGQRIPGAWFDRLATFARRAAEQPGDLLVHCHMGINRGPSGAFAVLLSQGIDPIEAITTIRGQRPKAAVAYAEDALAWWLGTMNADPERQAREFARLARWRADNPHDTVRIIRAERARGN